MKFSHKSLYTLLICLAVSTQQAHGILDQLKEYKAIIKSRPAESSAEKEAVEDVKKLLQALNHPDPKCVAVRFIDYRTSFYVSSSNTIYLNKTADRFVRAHEAAHATYDSSLSQESIFLHIGMYLVEYFIINKLADKGLLDARREQLIFAAISVLSHIAAHEGFFLKFISQPRELRADVKGCEALLKLGDQKTVQDILGKLDDSSFLHGIKIGNEDSKHRAARRWIEQRSGFYLDQHAEKLTVDYSRGSSETFWNNWQLHPKIGTRYFAIKEVLKKNEQQKKNERLAADH